MLCLSFYTRKVLSTLLQTVVTEINHAIGAKGVVSTECKLLVSQYGDVIWDLLVSGVSFLASPFHILLFSLLLYNPKVGTKNILYSDL